MRTDGTNRRLINMDINDDNTNKNWYNYNCYNINVVEDWVFCNMYYKYSGGWSRKIYRMKADGTDKKLINEDSYNAADYEEEYGDEYIYDSDYDEYYNCE
jgi:hypothetical protein